MTTRRDGFGRIRRDEGNRDYRRKHFEGARRLMEKGRPVESFGSRMKAALLRFLAH